MLLGLETIIIIPESMQETLLLFRYVSKKRRGCDKMVLHFVTAPFNWYFRKVLVALEMLDFPTLAV